MLPKASSVCQCHECIMKTIKPLVAFTRLRKTKTSLSVSLTMVNVFDELQMKILNLYPGPTSKYSRLPWMAFNPVLISIHSYLTHRCCLNKFSLTKYKSFLSRSVLGRQGLVISCFRLKEKKYIKDLSWYWNMRLGHFLWCLIERQDVKQLIWQTNISSKQFASFPEFGTE